MACKSCAQKQQGMTNMRAMRISEPTPEAPCKYTLEELFALRVESVQNNNTIRTALINSAINFYAKNCNKYSKHL